MRARAWRLRWFALAAALLVACLLAAPRAARAAEPRRWIYIVGRGAPKADVAAEGLLDRIDSAVLTGVRVALGRPRGERRFDDVQSYRRIAEAERSTLDPLEKLGLYGARDLTREADRARKRLQAKDSISLVQVVVFNSGTQSLRVDLEQYTLGDRDGDGLVLEAVKSAGGCGETEEEVLEELRRAAEDLVRRPRDDEDRAPAAVIAQRPAGPVTVGTEVVLDGCRSHAPGHDALVWTWRQVDGPPDARVIAASGVGGRKLRFAPEQPGTYAFELTVTRVVAGKGVARDSVRRTLEVYEKPHALPGVNRVVERLGERVFLEAQGQVPSHAQRSYRWVQIEGPHVILAAEGAAEARGGGSGVSPDVNECAAVKCSFTPVRSGLYTFELEVRDPIFSDRARVSILAAPPPEIRMGPAHATATPGQRLTLEGNGSFDEVDPDPVFLWEVVPGGKRPGTGIILLPSERNPTFVGGDVGAYKVSLRLGARRRLGDHTQWAYSSAEMNVQVRRWLLTLFFSLPNPYQFDGQDFRSYFAPTIGALIAAPGNDWVAVRITQSVARFYATEPEPNAKVSEQRVVPLSGSTVELGGWLWRPGRFGRLDLLAHAGSYLSLFDTHREVGPTTGLTATIQISGGWVGLLEGGYQHVFKHCDPGDVDSRFCDTGDRVSKASMEWVHFHQAYVSWGIGYRL